MSDPSQTQPNEARSKSFIKAALGTIITKFVLIFLKLATGIITARLLGPTGRGLFFMTVQTSGLSTTAAGLSVGEGLIFRIGKREIATEQIFAMVVLLVTLFSGVVLSLLAAFLPYLAEKLLSELPSENLPLLFLLPPAMLTEYISFSALKGLKRFKLANWLTILTRSNILLCLVIGVLVWQPTIGSVLTAFLIGSWLNALAFLAVLFQISGRRFSLPLRQIIPTIKYGGSAHIGTLLTEVEYRLDTFILLYFVNAAAVGIYSLGVTLVQILWYVSNSINTVLFPYLVETDKEDRDQFTAVVVRHSFYLNLVLLILLAIFGMPLVTLLYGSLFAEAYYVFLILAPGILCDTVSRSMAAWLKGGGRPLMLSWISALSLVANIALNLYFIPRYGLYGAAISSALTYVARAVILIGLFRASTGISPLALFHYTRSDRAKVVSLAGLMLKRLRRSAH